MFRKWEINKKQDGKVGVFCYRNQYGTSKILQRFIFFSCLSEKMSSSGLPENMRSSNLLLERLLIMSKTLLFTSLVLPVMNYTRNEWESFYNRLAMDISTLNASLLSDTDFWTKTSRFWLGFIQIFIKINRSVFIELGLFPA